MEARDRILGSLIGTAVGDALGLAYEGLAPRRAEKLLGPPDRYRLVAGRGLVSDDTEHACMALQALAECGTDPNAFQRSLARRLRNWLLQLPAGVGLATLRACLKLALGVPCHAAGVWSAGNGPCMRAVVLGAAVPDARLREELVRKSSLLTHRDPRAVEGAILLAKAATVLPARFMHLVPPPSPEWEPAFEALTESIARGEPTEAFAARFCGPRGVSGFVLHTVPVVLHTVATHTDDFFGGVQSAVRCGGDADTTAGLVGGLLGAHLGLGAIPESLLLGLADRPRTLDWLERLAEAVAAGDAPPEIPVLQNLARNAGFAGVVLLHGLRRLAPPY